MPTPVLDLQLALDGVALALKEKVPPGDTAIPGFPGGICGQEGIYWCTGCSYTCANQIWHQVVHALVPSWLDYLSLLYCQVITAEPPVLRN